MKQLNFNLIHGRHETRMGSFNHPLLRISCRPCFLPPLLGKACKYVGIFHPHTVDLFHGHAWIIPKKKLILGLL